MTVEIIPVSGIRKFLTFCRLPRQIYKGMDGYAPPLDAERWTSLAPALNPHFKLVDSQAFIAKKDGKALTELAGLQLSQATDFQNQYGIAYQNQQIVSPSTSFLPGGPLGKGLGTNPIEQAPR